MLVGGFDFALRQDLASDDPTDDKFVRLITFDPVTGEALAEYGYPLDRRPARIEQENQAFMGGLFDLAAIDDSGTIIAVEYSLETGSLELRLFEIDLGSAEAGTPSSASPPLLEKRWIADLSALGISETNYQGMGRGPDLADGRRTLILVSDNEFDSDTRIVALGLELG
jgi:3-phytase/alkaline phosphatase D